MITVIVICKLEQIKKILKCEVDMLKKRNKYNQLLIQLVNETNLNGREANIDSIRNKEKQRKQ